MPEIILRDPSLLKKGMVFKFPAGLIEDYIQDHFEFIEWVGPESIKMIVKKAVSMTWSRVQGQEYIARWPKDSFVVTGFVILSNPRVEYKRISRRAHD